MSVSKYGFQPGNKLGGRTVEGEKLRFACRKVTDKIVYAWIDALTAVDSEGNPDHDIRIKAANALADRGYGKPAQEVTASVDVTNSTADDLHAQIATILAGAVSEADEEPTGEAN